MLRQLIDRVFYGAHGEAMRYLFFGGLNVLVTWGSYAVLVLAGLAPVWSNVASWVIGVLFAFVVNKLYVFESRGTEGGLVLRELGSFFGARILSGCVNWFGFPALVWLGMTQSLLGIEDFLAKIVVTVIEVVLNYLFSKYFVFSRGQKLTRERERDGDERGGRRRHAGGPFPQRRLPVRPLSGDSGRRPGSQARDGPAAHVSV